MSMMIEEEKKPDCGDPNCTLCHPELDCEKCLADEDEERCVGCACEREQAEEVVQMELWCDVPVIQ